MIQELVTTNWITIYFLFLLGLLVAVNYLFPLRFKDFYRFHYSDQYIVKYKPTTNIFFSFNLALFLFQMIVMSLLFFKIILFFYGQEENQFLFFLKTVVVYGGFLLFRYLLGKLVCFAFHLNKEQEEVSFIKTTYIAKFSVYAYPFIILGFYLPFNTDYLFISIGVVLLVYLFIYYVNIIKFYRKKMFTKWYYFILYLCALEIAPIILLYKVLV